MQGQTLRVSATQITSPIIAVQPGHPTFIPSMAIPQAMQQYVPYIASMVQIEVESKAGQSPLRVHAHNLLSHNGFQNTDYAELLDMVLNYIHALMSSQAANQYNGDINTCIQNIVPHVVGAWSAAQVRLYPELMNYLNPQQQGIAQNAVLTMQQIVNEIARFKNGGFQQPPPGYGHPSQMAPQMQPMVPSWAQSPPQQYGYQPQQFPQQQMLGAQPGYAPQGHGAPSGLFVNNRATPYTAVAAQAPSAPAQATSASERMRRQLAEQNGLLPVAPPVTQAQQPPTPAPTKLAEQLMQQVQDIGVKLDTSGMDPELTQRYKNQLDEIASHFDKLKSFPLASQPIQEERPSEMNGWQGMWPAKPPEAEKVEKKVIKALNLEESQKSLLTNAVVLDVNRAKWKPSIHQPYHPAWTVSKHKLAYFELADKSVIAIITQLEPNDMDYDAHAIGVRPTTTASFSQNEQGKVSKKEGDEITNIDYPEANIEFIVSDDVMVEISDRIPAVTAGVMGSLAGFITKKTQALHTTTVVAEPILTNSKDVASYLTSMILRCNECTTFAQLHSVMQEMSSPDELTLRQRINQVMTKAINEVLKANIGANVYIDSFEEDGDTLISQLRKVHTDRIADAVASDQTRIIKSNLSIIDEDAIKSMNETLKGAIPEDSEVEGYIAFIACRVTHTHLEYTAAELALAFPRRAVSLLSEELTPVMFYVAKEVFESAEHEKTPIARHFIVTKDGLIVQLHNGLFNSKAYLVNIVD